LTKRILHIGLFLCCAAILTFGSYQVVSRLFRTTVQLDVNLKSFDDVDLTLFYNDHEEIFIPGSSDKIDLQASQFLKNITFNIPGTAEASHLKLRMGYKPNVLIVERVSLILKGMTRRDTLMSWQGRDIRQLIGRTQELDMPSDNPNFLQITTGNKDPHFIFSDVIAKQIAAHTGARPMAAIKVLFTSVLIALFLTVTLFYFVVMRIPASAAPSLIRNGGTLIIGFSTIIFLVFINNELELIPDMKNNENRTAARKPVLSYRNFFDFPDEYANYARDNFSFRNFLFYTNSLLKVELFGTSPLPQDVIVGKNGWFFYNEAGSIMDTRRFTTVSPAELMIMSTNVLQKKNWLARKNIRFYLLVPPNKDRVYPEYLPAGYFVTNVGANRLDYYKAHLLNNYNFKLIDPTDSLLAAKKRRDVYYTTDTHWNLYGGFKGYQVLMNEMVKDFPQLQPAKEEDFIITEETTPRGDIAGLIGLQDVFTRKEYNMRFRDTSKSLIPATTSEIFIPFKDNKTIDGSKLKVIMFRDSYANYLIPFLNMHFKDAIYVWSYEFMDKLIEEQQPDVVIFESLQRFMGAACMIPNPKGVE